MFLNNGSRFRLILTVMLSGLCTAGPLRAEDAKPSVAFLDKAAAAEAVVDDAAEPYFSKLRPPEMSVKTGAPITGDTLDAQRAETRRRYAAETLDFSDDEKAALTRLVERLHPILEKDYPRLAKTPWSFLKLSQKIEGGLPHTRGAHIVLSPPVLGGLVQGTAPAAGDAGVARFAGLLLHEQLHVFQRANPVLFAKLYTDVWGFRRAAKIDPGERLAERILLNPDAVELPWVLPVKADGTTRFIWPALVFAKDAGDNDRLSFRDLKLLAVELAEDDAGALKGVTGDGGEPVTHELLSVEPFTALFKPSTYIYHPNEAAADLFSRIVIAETLAPEPALFEDHRESVEPVRQWFRKNL